MTDEPARYVFQLGIHSLKGFTVTIMVAVVRTPYAMDPPGFRVLSVGSLDSLHDLNPSLVVQKVRLRDSRLSLPVVKQRGKETLRGLRISHVGVERRLPTFD